MKKLTFSTFSRYLHIAVIQWFIFKDNNFIIFWLLYKLFGQVNICFLSRISRGTRWWYSFFEKNLKKFIFLYFKLKTSIFIFKSLRLFNENSYRQNLFCYLLLIACRIAVRFFFGIFLVKCDLDRLKTKILRVSKKACFLILIFFVFFWVFWYGFL
jgi:hypothetical protein